jgi:hypothetical protein
MDSLRHMDRNVYLEGIENMGQIRCIAVYLQLESLE